MSNQFNASNLMFNVYQTKRGGFGIRLIAPPSKLGRESFVICSYLDEVSGEALFGSHPVLAGKWSAAKNSLIYAKQQAGILERVQAEPIAPVQAAPAPEVKRGPGRPRKTRIVAESVQGAPMQAAPMPVIPVAPVQAAPQVDLNALAAQVNALTQAMTALLAPRK